MSTQDHPATIPFRRIPVEQRRPPLSEEAKREIELERAIAAAIRSRGIGHHHVGPLATAIRAAVYRLETKRIAQG